MSTHFHEAAKNGLLDPLREATKRDCNRTDDTGMTPALYAAYEGHVEALRLIVSRGGDPNKADLQGHTALHFAALNGQRTVIEFLVAYGCNLWALNNEYRTAMQLAAEHGNREVVRLLDDVSGRQAATNKKVVQKAKEKAIKETDERIKKYSKMVKEHEKRMVKEAKRDSKDLDRPYNDRPTPAVRGTSITALEQRYSDVVNSKSTKSKGNSSSVATAEQRKRSDDDGTSSTGVMASESENAEINQSESDTMSNYRDSRFWLPNRNSGVMTSLPREEEAADIDDALAALDKIIQHENGDPSPAAAQQSRRQSKDSQSIHSRTAKPGDSISTVFRGDQAMWAEVEIDLEDDVDPSASAIELFLTVNDLADYIPVFYEEDIDMKALELLTDQDILDLKLPIGPRRKLNQAIAKRKESLSLPGVIQDSAI